MGTFSAIRLIIAVIIFLSALLTFVPPNINFVWKLSIVVLEGGYWMVLPCIILALVCLSGNTFQASGKIAALLFLISAILFSSPLIRAVKTANRLENNYQEGFGRTIPKNVDFNRSQILSFKDLWFGIKFKTVEPQTMVYARHDTSELKLDFYPANPKLRKHAPCIVLIHGGGWDSDDRKELPKLNSYLASIGYSVASIDYRLAPKNIYPAQIEDVKDAMSFLRRRSVDLDIDTSRFVLLGRSAGGQIALQAAYTFKDPAIKGVIAFYAPADMVWGYSIPTSPLLMNSRKLLDQYLGVSYYQNHEPYIASSPLESVKADSPPTLFLQGGNDVIVSPKHVVHMEAKMKPIGATYFKVDLPWTTHAYDFVFSGPGSQISLYFVERFLARVTE